MRNMKKWGVSAILAMALGVALPDVAAAQSPPTPQPPPGAPPNASPPSESTTPPPVPGAGAGESNEPLSDELKRGEGVLEPPSALDNGIVRKAPVPDPGTTPVIPPPGSPGGDPDIKPK